MRDPHLDLPELFSPVRSENNHTELYVDGPAVKAMLIREIRNAQHYIHFQAMLFYSDEAGFAIANALAEKSREGVEVRVMSDADMSSIAEVLEKFRSKGTSDFSKIKTLLQDAGVKFVASDKESYKLYNWDEVRAKLSARGVPEEFLVMQDHIQEAITTNANTLDHRKIFIFDGAHAIATGMNIGDKYLYDEQALQQHGQEGHLWHDGAVLIKGPCATTLNKNFASKWMVRGGDVFDYRNHYRSSDSYGTDACTVFSHFPGMEQNYIRDYYLRKLKECQGEFIIENPYINDEQFWQTLSNLDEEQAKKITFINPYKAKGNDYAQNESTIQCHMWTPFQNGVSFYSYRKRMSHWKLALDVAKSEVFLGSYNLNHRSAHHDFELNVLIESPSLAEKVKAMLDADMKESVKISDANEFYQHPNLYPSCLLLKATEFFE